MVVLQPQHARMLVWPILRSLAATSRISFDFFSCRYLDVSVPCVRSTLASFSPVGNNALTLLGYPIQVSPAQSLFND